MDAQGTTGSAAEGIVEEAAGRSARDRRTFLDASCGRDTALRALVESLLSGRHGPADGATPTRNSLKDALTRIDRYRLLQKIGEGGFGTVYLAEQERPVRRRVALKVIKAGMDTRQVIARFEAERQALALMDHPNITRVLDAGSTPEGLPFFVMELVRGTPINSYCDGARLGTRQRLEMFLQVCHAVRHAHQKGVIHRDLKPTNILVAFQDGSAVPKVIDFGIAKAMQARLTPHTVFTDFRHFIGTPEYMSPEQAGMAGLDVDTRSDVYALGVLLYELLTGATPFAATELRGKPYDEIQRVIREVEPPRPSVRLAGLGERLPSVAACRRVDAERLAQSMRGELDWVVMKCLEKDRTRRYESVGDLAADVQRYLADEPVLARPSGLLYQAGKFARKHRAPVVAAGAVAAALVLGLAGTLLGLARARHDRDEAVRARVSESAQRQAQERASEDAQTANRFLLSLHSVSAPYDDTRTIREKLSEVAAKLEGGWLAEQPKVRIAVLSAMGEGYRGLGDYARSERHLLSALALSREVHGERHPEVGCQLHLLGSLYETRRDYAEAERCFRDALALFRASAPGEGHVSMVLNPRRAKDLGVRRGVDAHLSMVITLRDLAFVREKQGDPAGARALRRESHEVGIAWRTNELAAHPGDWYLVFTRGMLHARLVRFREALADVRQATQLNPSDHWGWYYAAYFQLFLGDEDAHRRTRREMLARFTNAPSREARFRTIEASLLAPCAGEDLPAVRSAIDIALAGDTAEPVGSWLQLYKGMAQYRAGELEAALESLATPRAAGATYLKAPAQFYTAMANHGLGRTADADAALARGVALVDARMPLVPREDLGSSPEHWLLCQIARREAEHLLLPGAGVTPAAPPAGQPSPGSSTTSDRPGRSD